ncbi:dienelactone hydrolase family protein [Streptosporangium sp. NPDC049644]|uniref:dienelactone hydrolase family protein n=1 Tax=Streptosporangium sp. NPDC049644 TaxID=3155507 RepID=UPI0034161132
MSHHHAHGSANRGRVVLQTAAPLFVCEPAGEPVAGVIVLHDVWGITPPVESRMRALSGRGWLTVAPYLFYRSGGPDFTAQDRARAEAAMSEPSTEDLAADFDAALDYLVEKRGVLAETIAVVGFGTGGYLAAWAAGRHRLAAGVSIGGAISGNRFWPSTGTLPDLVSTTLGPWMSAPETDSTGAEPREAAAAQWGAAIGFLKDRLPDGEGTAASANGSVSPRS